MLADNKINRIFADLLRDLKRKRLGKEVVTNFINLHQVMTKADIVSEIAKQTGAEKVQVQAIVEAFMESIKGSLAENENVYLRGFGSFIIKQRAQKVARNISKNTTITIPAHNIPAFKPAKSFTAKIK